MSGADRRALLDLARWAIEAHLGRRPPPAADDTGRAAQPAGAFVTVLVRDDLRGCIGLPEASQPLGEVVRHCAVAAAFEDPRFRSIRAEELPHLSIEISILSALRPLRSADEIVIGRHGLVVEQGRCRGLLLPQVAAEHRWTVETFLRETCRKAGLPPDAWQQGASVEVFEAEVIRDGEDGAGNVERRM